VAQACHIMGLAGEGAWLFQVLAQAGCLGVEFGCGKPASGHYLIPDQGGQSQQEGLIVVAGGGNPGGSFHLKA